MNATTAKGSARPILVGIDGSSSALAVARWAAREAVARRAPIRLVTPARGPSSGASWPARC